MKDVPWEYTNKVGSENLENLEIENIKAHEEDLIKKIKTNYEKYLEKCKSIILRQIAMFSPNKFEAFSKNF